MTSRYEANTYFIVGSLWFVSFEYREVNEIHKTVVRWTKIRRSLKSCRPMILGFDDVIGKKRRQILIGQQNN